MTTQPLPQSAPSGKASPPLSLVTDRPEEAHRDRDADWPTADTDPAAAQAMLHTVCWDSSYTDFDRGLAARGALSMVRTGPEGRWRGLPPEDADPHAVDIVAAAVTDTDLVLDAVHALGLLPEPHDRDFGALLAGALYDLAVERDHDDLVSAQQDQADEFTGGDMPPAPGDPDREAYLRALCEQAPA